jgi:hypothetical protein
MRGVESQRAYDFAKRIDARLKATDPRLRRSVRIATDDEASLFFEDAFILRWGGWILLFTEHHEFDAFWEEDLLWCAEYQRINNEPEEVSGEDVEVRP